MILKQKFTLERLGECVINQIKWRCYRQSLVFWAPREAESLNSSPGPHTSPDSPDVAVETAGGAEGRLARLVIGPKWPSLRHNPHFHWCFLRWAVVTHADWLIRGLSSRLPVSSRFTQSENSERRRLSLQPGRGCCFHGLQTCFFPPSSFPLLKKCRNFPNTFRRRDGGTCDEASDELSTY